MGSWGVRFRASVVGDVGAKAGIWCFLRCGTAWFGSRRVLGCQGYALGKYPRY